MKYKPFVIKEKWQKKWTGIKTIRSRMLLWFGLSLGGLMIVIGLATYAHIRDTVVPLTNDLTQEVLKARSAEMGRLIQGYMAEVRSIAASDLMRSGDYNAIGSNLVRRAGTINPDFEILFYTDATGRYITSKGAVGNVADRDYWKAIMVQGKDEAISNPLVSKSTGENIFVIASVVKNDRGERIGIAAATVLLQTLSEIAKRITLGESGDGWIADSTGLCVAHRNPALPMKVNMRHTAQLGYKGLDEIGERLVRGEAGRGTFTRPNGTQIVTVFNPIPNTPGWTFGINLEHSDLMERPERLIRRIAWLMAGLLAAMLVVVILVSRKITEPVRLLQEGVDVVSTGHLDHVLDIRTGDEIQRLAETFNKMTGDLKNHIANLQKVTMEKERAESDLRVANKIQASMLPRVFPPFPDIANIDLFAIMEPAREVGGDFFDFFVLDDKRLCFSIGDVSGKGVPAALFMVITMTILRNQVTLNPSLKQVFRQTNAMLCLDNDENMFVTLFMAILDPRTGELEYINAGHNPPLLSRDGKDFEFLDVQPSLVLGGMENYAYDAAKTVLRPGDIIFLYTDGVTEAMNPSEELFGNDRTIAALNALKGRSVHDLIHGMRESIRDFTRGAPAWDDITMLAVTLDETANLGNASTPTSGKVNN